MRTSIRFYSVWNVAQYSDPLPCVPGMCSNLVWSPHLFRSFTSVKCRYRLKDSLRLLTPSTTGSLRREICLFPSASVNGFWIQSQCCRSLEQNARDTQGNLARKRETARRLSAVGYPWAYIFGRFKRRGLYHPRGVIVGIKKRLKKTRFRKADQNTFCIYWYLIEPQGVIKNLIHFQTVQALALKKATFFSRNIGL